MKYESTFALASREFPGVSLTLNRMSLERRIELMRHVRELTQRAEFHEASDGLTDKFDASLLAEEADRIFLRWGLRSVEGLDLDGEAATVDALIARGPEKLCREALAAIKAECGLSPDERKN